MAKEYVDGEFTVKTRPVLSNVWMYVAAICIAVYVVQTILGASFTNYFMLNSSHISDRPWTLVTSMFLHGGFFHILMNMLTLMFCGPLLEAKIGSKKFLFVYLVGGIFGNLIGAMFYPAALGASGAIMAALGCLVVVLPKLKVMNFIFFIPLPPMPLWMSGILWAFLNILGTIDSTSNIGYMAHLGGMAFGLLFGFYLRFKYNAFSKRIKGKKHLSSDDVDDMNRNYF